MTLIKTPSSDNLINLNNSLNEQFIFDDINNYKFDYSTKLGEGRFGKVRLAIHKLTNEKVAIKVIDKNQIKLKEQRQRIDNEISILKELNHYNIAKLYSSIENEERIYLIQEFIKGDDLNYFIKTKEKPEIREQNACIYFRQIISAIEYIHKMGIAHRDLKPENILINKNNEIKLIDFGLSKYFSKGELLKTPCGSPFYASPEMVKGNKYNGISSDIWSLGIILFYMLFQELPFMDADVNRLYKKILEGKYEIPEDKIKTVSKDAIDLLKKILEVNPKNRIKINGIIKHKWFNKFKNDLNIGINIKEIILPIDEEIVEEIKNTYGFDKMRIRNTIIRNLFNNIRSLYLIIVERKIKKEKESVSDLHSQLYKDYINDEKNKLKNYNNDLKNVLKERINSKEKLNELIDYEENQPLNNINNDNMLNLEEIYSHKKNHVRTNKSRALTIINKNMDHHPNLLFKIKNKNSLDKIKKEMKKNFSDNQNIKRLSSQNIKGRVSINKINKIEAENNNSPNVIKIRKNSTNQKFNSTKINKFPQLNALLNKKNLKNSINNSKTEKALNTKFNRNNNNLYKNNINISLSYDKTENINKFSKEITYKNQKDNINNIFSNNKNNLTKKSISSKNNNNITNINKNIQKESLLSGKSKENPKQNQKLPFSSSKNNNKKLSLKIENINNERMKIAMKPGKTTTNFKKIKNNNYESKKIINKKERNMSNEDIIKVKGNTINAEKNKTRRVISNKTNYNMNKKKFETKSAEKTKDSYISNRTSNINKQSINLDFINKSSLYTCNNNSIYNNNEKDINSFIITKNSEIKGKNELDNKIMVNIIKNDSKDIELKNIKISLNLNKNIENNSKENKIKFDNNINEEKKLNNFESPFDLSSLFIIKKDQNLKLIIEKYLKKNKYIFNSVKEKGNNIKKIHYNCNKKKQIKFNINIVKIKNDHMNDKEQNNFYICRIRNQSIIKFDFINILNSLQKALINK